MKLTDWPELYSTKRIEMLLEQEFATIDKCPDQILKLEIVVGGQAWIPTFTVSVEMEDVWAAEQIQKKLNGRSLQNYEMTSRRSNRGLCVEIETDLVYTPPIVSPRSSKSPTHKGPSDYTPWDTLVDNGEIFLPEDSIYLPWLKPTITHRDLGMALQKYGQILSLKLLLKQHVKANLEYWTNQAWVKFKDHQTQQSCLQSNPKFDNEVFYQLFELGCLKPGTLPRAVKYRPLQETRNKPEYEDDFTERSDSYQGFQSPRALSRSTSRERKFYKEDFRWREEERPEDTRQRSVSVDVSTRHVSKLNPIALQKTASVPESSYKCATRTESLQTTSTTKNERAESQGSQLSHKQSAGLALNSEVESGSKSLALQEGCKTAATASLSLGEMQEISHTMPKPSVELKSGAYGLFCLDQSLEATPDIPKLEQLPELPFTCLVGKDEIQPFAGLEDEKDLSKDCRSLADDTRDRTHNSTLVRSMERNRSHSREDERSISKDQENSAFLSAVENSRNLLAGNLSLSLDNSRSGAPLQPDLGNELEEDEYAQKLYELGSQLYEAFSNTNVFTGKYREEMLDDAVGRVLAAEEEKVILEYLKSSPKLLVLAQELYESVKPA